MNIERILSRARLFGLIGDDWYEARELGDSHTVGLTAKARNIVDFATSRHCHWNEGHLTDCGNLVIPKFLDNDDIEFCCYCGAQMEEWVTIS